jgi:hypothetical protein
MKVVTLATATLLMSASLAFAGAGAPVPPKAEGGPPSGRPTAVLDEAKCQSVWSLTQREGDTLVEDNAAPFIVNFKLVDTNHDGKITEAEFKAGCQNGLVQEQASKAPESGGGQTPEEPEAPTPR